MSACGLYLCLLSLALPAGQARGCFLWVAVNSYLVRTHQATAVYHPKVGQRWHRKLCALGETQDNGYVTGDLGISYGVPRAVRGTGTPLSEFLVSLIKELKDELRRWS